MATLEQRVAALERAVGTAEPALAEFNLAQVAPHESLCVVGRKGTGKTQVALALAAGREVTGVMCGTLGDADAWRRTVPAGTPLADGFNPHLLSYCLSLDNGCVVMDALAIDRSMMDTLRQATEHPKVGTVITAMYAAHGYPGGRYWLALREVDSKHRRMLHHATCAHWATLETFEKALREATAEQGAALVIDTHAHAFWRFLPQVNVRLV